MKMHVKMMAAVLTASLMMAMPMSTFAASQNSMTKEVIEVTNGTTFTTADTANCLRISFMDNCEDEEVFYFDLNNAVWNDAAIENYNATNIDGVQYQKQNDTVLKVSVAKETFEGAADVVTIDFPIVATVLGGEATVTARAIGAMTTISQGTFVFAEGVEAEMNISTLDLLKINFKDNEGTAEDFYLELNNATWDEQAIEAYNSNKSGIRYAIQSDTVVKVSIPKKVFKNNNATKKVTLPILADKQENATVSIVSAGSETTVKEAILSLS